MFTEQNLKKSCILSPLNTNGPLVFTIMIYWVLRRSTERSAGGITWSGGVHLCNLDFVDDIALTDDSWSSVPLTTSVLQEEARKLRLFMNPDKCNRV